MRILIAVLTCHLNRKQADFQRRTWAREIKGADLRFFLGKPERVPVTAPEPRADEVVLDVPDGYLSLPAKTQAICRWAIEHGYTHVFRVDDDVYVRPERLINAIPAADHCGRLRGPSGNYPAPYASGFAYWLSAKAAGIIAQAKLNGDTAEDRWVANVLVKHGIHCVNDGRYVVKKDGPGILEGCHPNNQVVASCEYKGPAMLKVHSYFERRLRPAPVPVRPQTPTPAPHVDLSDVCIQIKTFLRDGYLEHSLRYIERNLPGARMVVVDDGEQRSARKMEIYRRLKRLGHTVVTLPFDSGFGAKSNAAIRHYDRPYVLIASDDFDFSRPDVGEGIRRMLDVLRHDPAVAIASGRVRNEPYEGMLTIEGSTAQESWCTHDRPLFTEGGTEYHLCDLTVNYSLIRTGILGMDKVHWDSDVKIGGGEHGAFFIDVKRAGHKVAWVPGAIIHEQPHDARKMHHSYTQYRGRARQPGRICLKRRGIDRYVCFEGQVDIT